MFGEGSIWFRVLGVAVHKAVARREDPENHDAQIHVVDG